MKLGAGAGLESVADAPPALAPFQHHSWEGGLGMFEGSRAGAVAGRIGGR